MDLQTTELLGRNILINQLLEAGIEVAIPIRDKGVDIIAYSDENFKAIPIQLKAATNKSFLIDKKYKKFSELLIVFVWNFENPEIYALLHDECVSIAKMLGYTSTNSWRKNGKYTTTRPSKELVSLLQPYRMTSDLWKKRLNL